MRLKRVKFPARSRVNFPVVLKMIGAAHLLTLSVLLIRKNENREINTGLCEKLFRLGHFYIAWSCSAQHGRHSVSKKVRSLVFYCLYCFYKTLFFMNYIITYN